MTNDSNELEWSSLGNINKIIFLGIEYSLNIVVEDKDKEYFYEILFEKFKFNFDFNIIASESKQNSIKFFKEIKDLIQYRKELYFFIVDGDFDIFLGKEVIKSNNFLYLKRYNIESYLIQKEPICNALRKSLELKKSALKRYFNFDTWKNLNLKFFIDLFIIFIINYKYNLGLKTVSIGQKFLTNNGEINLEKRDELIEQIIEQISLKSNESTININKEIEIIKKFILNKNISLEDILCGKFLFNSLRRYVVWILNKNLSKKVTLSFNRLVVDVVSDSNLNISKLDYLKDSINNYVSNQENFFNSL